ncbi:MAG: hypothetical protein ACREVZ_08810 [Burkholderiales bacterium]
MEEDVQPRTLARLSESNTERVLVDWAHCTIRAGKFTSEKTAKSHHAPGYTYVITNRQSLALPGQLAPHLKSCKARRARLVLDNFLYVAPRNGKYDHCTRNARLEFEKTFAATSIRKSAPKE